MKTYNFTLVLSSIDQELLKDLEPIEDAIFEAGCDDATLCFRDLIPYLEFDRESSSFSEAVISAIQQIESINNKIKVEKIETDDLVSTLINSLRKHGVTDDVIAAAVADTKQS